MIISEASDTKVAKPKTVKTEDKKKKVAGTKTEDTKEVSDSIDTESAPKPKKGRTMTGKKAANVTTKPLLKNFNSRGLPINESVAKALNAITNMVKEKLYNG